MIHGDPHIGNLFDDDGRTGFLDWGIINVGAPMRDVSYFLTMAMSIDDRRVHERDLLRHYLDVRRRGGRPPSSRSTTRGSPTASMLRTTSPPRARSSPSPPACPSRAGCSATPFLDRAQASLDDLDARSAPSAEVAGL